MNSLYITGWYQELCPFNFTLDEDYLYCQRLSKPSVAVLVKSSPGDRKKNNLGQWITAFWMTTVPHTSYVLFHCIISISSLFKHFLQFLKDGCSLLYQLLLLFYLCFKGVDFFLKDSNKRTLRLIAAMDSFLIRDFIFISKEHGLQLEGWLELVIIIRPL